MNEEIGFMYFLDMVSRNDLLTRWYKHFVLVIYASQLLAVVLLGGEVLLVLVSHLSLP